MKKQRELTEQQRWYFVDMAIKAFISQYPTACQEFFDMVKAERTKFGVAEDKGMKQANQRRTMSFPVCRNPRNGDEDCLLPIIERYLPNFAHKDSKYYAEFHKRYPMFSAAEKL